MNCDHVNSNKDKKMERGKFLFFCKVKATLYSISFKSTHLQRHYLNTVLQTLTQKSICANKYQIHSKANVIFSLILGPLGLTINWRKTIYSCVLRNFKTFENINDVLGEKELINIMINGHTYKSKSTAYDANLFKKVSICQ